MTQNTEDTIENKHDNARKKRFESLKAKPIEGNSRAKAPSSSQVVLEAKEWYQNFAKLSLFALVCVSVCAAMAAISLVVVTSRPPTTLSYLMDEDGRVVRLESIRNPSLTEAEVLNWAAKRIKDIHTLTFTDYIDHVQSLRDDFTDEAYENYQRALLDSKSLQKIKEGRLMMWAKPLTAPKITESKVVNGKYTWVIEMELEQFMGGGNFVTSGTRIKGIMVVERVDRGRNLAGVVVSKYLSKEMGI